MGKMLPMLPRKIGLNTTQAVNAPKECGKMPGIRTSKTD